MQFKIRRDFQPAGDQPQAIKKLVEGVKSGLKHQTLFGVTGSGKTFTVANVIQEIQKPTLVIAHNKTLAAQLAQEYREFFPQNAVHYFVSYYDYYQPEAYIPHSDTYIEKEAMINEEIDRLRHASTQALLSRKDVIIVASVSCIYGLGSPESYKEVNVQISVGQKISRADFIRQLVDIHFERTNADLSPGQFRAIGNTLEIMPISEKFIFRLEIGRPDADVAGSESSVAEILKINPVTRAIIEKVDSFFLFPTKHFISSDEQNKQAFKTIKAELAVQLKKFEKEGKLLEAERLKRRTSYDLALIREMGYCNGIENYSRHFSGKAQGEPPDTLLSYFPHHTDKKGNYVADFLTVIDESHVSVPQIGAMYAGDASRKQSLVEYGFRLPSAKDNRPLKFEEFEKQVGQTIYTSATPSDYEKEHSAPPAGQIVEQVIRPTGLIDPVVEVRPIVPLPMLPKALGAPSEAGQSRKRTASTGRQPRHGDGQIADFIAEAEKNIKDGGRVIATTLTKKMAENLSEYLKEKGIKAEYLHSDIKTIERIEILTNLRKGPANGGFDVLVGVNLLREGLDLPEVTLIGILDADKEGFLRSDTSLIQIIGRAARNVKGRVILYADTVTKSMKFAMDETNRRREIQIAYNTAHNITPKTIIKKIQDITDQLRSEHDKAVAELLKIDKGALANTYAPGTPGAPKYLKKLISQKEKQMDSAVKILDFETAALLRDEIVELTKLTQTPKTPKIKNPHRPEDLLK
jgi:excinuclease ABC subunit B